MAPKRIKISCAEGMLLNLALLKLNVVISVLIVNNSTCSVKVNGFHIHAGYCRQ